MYRSAHSIMGLGSSLFGIATLGFATLGFLWSSPSQPTPPGKPEGEWRLLEPITYENLTVFPVVASSGYDTSGFLTLEEGLSSGEVIVREQGSEGLVRDRDGIRPTVSYSGGASVNQLVLINRSKKPLLLLAGELVSGGKQDRVIGKDRIVPVGAEPLPLERLLRGARALVVGFTIHCGENHCASQRARASGRHTKAERRVGVGHGGNRGAACRRNTGSGGAASSVGRGSGGRRTDAVLREDLRVASRGAFGGCHGGRSAAAIPQGNVGTQGRTRRRRGDCLRR